MKKVGLILLLLFAIAFIWLANKYLPQLAIANGYAAKYVCSYCLQGLPIDKVKEVGLATSPLNLVDVHYDPQSQIATASLFGLKKRTAIHRPGLGCSLLQGTDDYKTLRTSKNIRTRASTELPKSTTTLSPTSSKKIKELAFDKEGEWVKMTTSLNRRATYQGWHLGYK